jgi:serine/threonine protein kinase
MMAGLDGGLRGNYKLTQLLGQGGFAEVYLGEHIHLGSKAAIKVLSMRLDESGIQQFRQEAITLKSLNHPNIVKILDFGFDDRQIPYLIMEYAPNGTLGKRHRPGQIVPIPTVVDYIKQIALALQYAHDNRIIHRDIKPANMLIDQNNAILLSDFGIARVVQTYSVGTNHVAGSFQYMAPEQASRKPVYASDQYSLAIVAYQWLCGKLPFEGDYAQLMHQHLTQAPPPFPATLNIPASVETTIMKALAKDPQQRFATVKEFAQELESGLTSRLPPPIRRKYQPPVVIEQKPASISPLSLEQIYDSGLTAKNKYDLEQAYSDWTAILKREPDYMNGVLAQRVKELKLDLIPFRVDKLSQQVATLKQQGWQADWQTTKNAVQSLLNDNPQNKQLQSLLEAVQEMLKLQQDNAKYQPLYEIVQRYVEEAQQATDTTIQSDKIAKAKSELDYLQQKTTTFGDPAGLASTIYYIEWQLAEPQRQREKERIDSAFALLSICIALLPGGIGATVDLLYQFMPLVILIALVIIIAVPLLIVLFSIVRKPHNQTSFVLIRNFVLAILFTFALAIGSWLLLSHLDHSAFAGGIFNGHYYVGRQINFGLILGAFVTTGTFVVEYFGNSNDFYGSFFYGWSSRDAILFLSIVGAIGNAALYGLVGLAGSYFHWGFGFGYSWNYALFAMLVGIVAVTGIVLFIYFLFLFQRIVRGW